MWAWKLLRQGEGGPGSRVPKILEKYFSGNYQLKLGHFSGKYHVKFGHFVNFPYMHFGAKMASNSKVG